MSRIGRKPIDVPKDVDLNVKEHLVEVKGPKGTLTVDLHEKIHAELVDGSVTLSRDDDEKTSKCHHGLCRSLIHNAIEGVSKGFVKELELVGVGYKVNLKGSDLELNVGYSHPVHFTLPQGVDGKVEGNKISLSGCDKQLVGETAAQIRRVRPPEPYKGKGIKYVNEQIRRKAGKSGAK
ncbi:50S ribosomal protein L6 [Desulfoplanes formicivorans]|uniref:Large ribosomal subunit protein uL6 n=1 Tax=Desulfoplanes formicivorans TaxID=1592317 RepID=A0A194AFH2_9BACT|nr:50S ribosomal protein L6 [Desulfoplanes formicivorans]GAU07529.1 50S ribosomal protein L6 [Desulfoplanes formicivorans]